MKSKIITGLTIAATVAAIALPTPASAHGWGGRGGWHGGHGGGGLFFGLAAATGAVIGAAATIATAPVRIIADAADGPAPAPVYAAPQPAYYAAPAPAYYYAPRPVAYYPAPAYYYGYR